MKKLQRSLIQIMIFGILVSVFVPGIFYFNWYLNTQREKVQELFGNESHEQINWLFSDMWNAETYIDSMLYVVERQHMKASDLKNEDFIEKHLKKMEDSSDELLCGIDYFSEIEYYINPELTDGNKFLFRVTGDDGKRFSADFERGKSNLEMAMNLAKDAKDGLWLSPYYNEASSTTLISYIKSIYLEDGTFLGVVGVTYDYDNVKKSLAKSSKKYNKIFSIYSKEEQLMSPEHVPNISKADLALIMDTSENKDIYDVKTDGGRYTVYAYQLLDDEYILVFVKNTILFKEHYVLVASLIAIAFLVTFVFAFIMVKVVRYVFKRVQIDNLTSAYNRNAYMDVIDEIANTIHTNHEVPFTIVVFDINGLKLVNDKKGHVAGDQMIKKAYDILKETFPKECIYRIGGDEFSIICKNKNQSKFLDLLDEFYDRMDKDMYNYKQDNGVVLISAGYASYDSTTDNCYDDTFNRADKMMYEKKEAFYEMYPELRRK